MNGKTIYALQSVLEANKERGLCYRGFKFSDINKDTCEDCAYDACDHYPDGE